MMRATCGAISLLAATAPTDAKRSVDPTGALSLVARANATEASSNDEASPAAMKWSFTWPYSGPNRRCDCVSNAKFGEYSTRRECLLAFATSPYETCSAVGVSGVSAKECKLFAVSKDIEYNNEKCAHACVRDLVGRFKAESSGMLGWMDWADDHEESDDTIAESRLREEEEVKFQAQPLVAGVPPVFDDFCRFEYTVVLGSTANVATPVGGCYNNYVFGVADPDPSLIFDRLVSVERLVESPAMCQTRCQKWISCIHFTWNSLDLSCILHTAAFMETALIPLEPTVPADVAKKSAGGSCARHGGANHSPSANDDLANCSEVSEAASQRARPDPMYCDYDRVSDCADLFIVIPEAMDPFNQKCFICDCLPRCVYATQHHISGPAFCDAEHQACDYLQPATTFTPTIETGTTVEVSSTVETGTTIVVDTTPMATSTTTTSERPTNCCCCCSCGCDSCDDPCDDACDHEACDEASCGDESCPDDCEASCADDENNCDSPAPKERRGTVRGDAAKDTIVDEESGAECKSERRLDDMQTQSALDNTPEFGCTTTITIDAGLTAENAPLPTV